MEIEKLNSLFRLQEIVNNGKQDEIDSVIANYLLVHFNQLDQLSVNTIVDECFISRSALRRFCKKQGFDNFKDYRKSILSVPKVIEKETRTKNFTQNLNHFLEKIENRNFLDCVKELCSLLDGKDNIVFLATSTTSAMTIEFQQMMIEKGKLIYSFSNERKIIKQEADHTIYIVLSATGTFADSILPYLEHTKKILITFNDQYHHASFNKIYYLYYDLKDRNINQFSKYGYMYLLDKVIEDYGNTH